MSAKRIGRTERFMVGFLEAAAKRDDGAFAGAYYVKASNFDKWSTVDLLRILVARGHATVSEARPSEQIPSDFHITAEGREAIAAANGGRVFDLMEALKTSLNGGDK